MTINAQLKALRRLRGVTQHELAALMGINQSSVARAEKDGYMPSLRYVKKVADVLGASLKIIAREK